MEDKFLPLDSVSIYDENSDVKLPNNVETEEDCHQVMRFIVHETRKNLSIYHDVMNDPLENKCNSAKLFVSELCEEHHFSDEGFSLGQDLSPGLFHCFNVVSFNVNGKVKSYLVDCTYRQFFTYAKAFLERIGLPYNSGASIELI